ncbi:MAG: hypothetical protein E6J75_11910 [Deltaproteobacteria bacterium]|nr:MAG: hypothetical protein E6J75_11910 [Deltaproteobacteria bacterium]
MTTFLKRPRSTSAKPSSGDEVREEADEEREVAQVVGGRGVAAVDVHRVAHRLEGVEADPGRQQDAEQADVDLLDAERVQEVDEAPDEEVAVLEEAEDRQVGDHADGEEGLPPRALREGVEPGQEGDVGQGHRRRGERHGEVAQPLRERAEHRVRVEVDETGCQRRVADVAAQHERAADQQRGEPQAAPLRQLDAGDAETADEVDDRRDEDQEEEPVVPEAVEDVAGDQQEVVLPPVAEPPVEGVHRGEQQPEGRVVVVHARLAPGV